MPNTPEPCSPVNSRWLPIQRSSATSGAEISPSTLRKHIDSRTSDAASTSGNLSSVVCTSLSCKQSFHRTAQRLRQKRLGHIVLRAERHHPLQAGLCAVG